MASQPGFFQQWATNIKETGHPELTQQRLDNQQDALKASITPHVQAIQGLRTDQAHITDPKTGLPLKGYEQQYNEITDAMQGHVHAMRQIYYPDHQASPLEHFGQHITDKLHLTSGLKRANDQQRKQDAGDEQDRSQTQAYQQSGGNIDPAALSVEQQNQANQVKAGIVPKAVTPKNDPENWTTLDVKFKDGTTQTVQRNTKSGEITDLAGNAIPPERLSSATAVPKAAPVHPLGVQAQYTGLLAKKLLADRRQGPPLTNEEAAQLQATEQGLTVAAIARAHEAAKAQAEYNVIPTTNTDTGSEQLSTRAQAAHAAQSGSPMTPGAVGAPTAHDKTTQVYATSALNRLKEMREIINRNKFFVGPEAGRAMKVSTWLGSQSPDAQKFQNDAQFLAEHSTAVFGGRAASTVEAMKNIMANPNTNPDALLAGFDSDESTLKDFLNPGGRLPPHGPKTQQLSGGGGAKHKIKIGTKMYTYNGTGDTADLKNYTEVK